MRIGSFPFAFAACGSTNTSKAKEHANATCDFRMVAGFYSVLRSRLGQCCGMTPER